MSYALIHAYREPPFLTVNSLFCFLVDATDWCFVQRIVVGQNYFESSTKRFDYVVEESDTAETLTKSKKAKLHFWFVKVLSCVTTQRSQKSSEQSRIHSMQRCLKCKIFCGKMVAFEQRFEVVDEQTLFMDEVYTILKTVKLRW